ncbi:hypothetical protein ACFYO2_26525 [Streptomyces sp. NPDC006602]|uniref:hypothetical protein n=1 Tax=Streptomyces sp. NPDC006602 TaxID=3364751 RepID=UPI0036C37752
MDFETLAQLSGNATHRVVYQVEYAKDDSDKWEFVPVSQHSVTLGLWIGQNRAACEAAESQARASLEKIQSEHRFTRIVTYSAHVMEERECAPVKIYVDEFEPGKALVTLPNGGARIGRQGSTFWVDCTEWDESDVSPLPRKGGFPSQVEAATWMAREMGHKGLLDIREEKEF